MRSRLIKAFYAGQCRVCNKALPKGADVYFAKHYGLRCPECGPHSAEDTRLSAKREKAKPVAAPSPKFKPADEQTGFNAAGRAAVKDADGIHRIEYGSIREVVEDALSDYAQNDSNLERLRAVLKGELDGDSKWANYFTREKLLQEVFRPSGSLLWAVDAMREQLLGELDLPTQPRRKLRRGQDWGDELNADRWLARDPSAWERFEKKLEPRRTVTIGCNLSAHHRVLPSELLYRGAAALALADHLTTQGCNVGIQIFKSTERPTNLVQRFVGRVEVKAPDMPLDLQAVAFAFCEIAFYRCVMVIATARRVPGILSGGFGSPTVLPDADKTGLDFLIDADVLGETAALNWLHGQIAVQEVCRE